MTDITQESLLAYVEFRKKNKLKPMTNTERAFAVYFLETKLRRDLVAAIGGVSQIFDSIRSFLKGQPQPKQPD